MELYMKYSQSKVLLLIALFGFNLSTISMEDPNKTKSPDMKALLEAAIAQAGGSTATAAQQPTEVKLTLSQLLVLQYPLCKIANGIIKAVRAQYDNNDQAIAAVRQALTIRSERRKIDVKDTNGKNALMYAAMFGLDHLIPILVTEGNAGLEVTDLEYQTALILAAFYDRSACVKALLDLNANRFHTTRMGQTALSLAQWNKSTAVKALISNHIPTKTPSISLTAIAAHNKKNKKIKNASAFRPFSPAAATTAVATASKLPVHSSAHSGKRSVTAPPLRLLAPSPEHSESTTPASLPSSSPEPQAPISINAPTNSSPALSISPQIDIDGGANGNDSPFVFSSSHDGLNVTLSPIAHSNESMAPLELLAAASTQKTAKLTADQPKEDSDDQTLAPSPLLASLQQLDAQSPKKEQTPEQAARAKKEKKD